MPQVPWAQLVSLDSKAPAGSEDLPVNRSWAAAAPSLRSSLPKVLIYGVPPAHLAHLGLQDLPFQAHQDPEAQQGKACQAHQAHQDLS